MPTGMIFLLNPEEEVVDKHRYSWVAERQRIIEKWEKNYGLNEGYMVQIFPHTVVGRVRQDGTNMQVRKEKPSKPDSRRPPSEYSNKRSLYDLDDLP